MAGRAIDYFLVVGPTSPFHAIDPPHPSSTQPPRSFIDRTYATTLLFRYPASDHSHLPLPPGLPMFAMPDDLKLSATAHMPTFFYFVATGGQGERLYGSCLRLWEEVSEVELSRLVAEEKRREQDREREETERRERGDSLRRKETSVSLSKEEERETELEEQLEREQAKRLISMHDKIQEEQAKWREHKQQQQQQQHRAVSPSKDSAAAVEQQRITIQLPASSPASSSSPTSTSQTSDLPRTARSTSPSPHSSPNFAAASPPSTRLHPFNSTSPFNSTTSLRARKIYAPKCLVTLSLHPFLSQCRSFLTEMYRLSLVPSGVPLEHYIANFINEVPLPPYGELKVQYSISNKLIYFFRPPANNPLLFTHYPLRLMFEFLDSDNALLLLEAVLMEQRVLLLSSKLSALTVVGETLLHLLFPLRWPHVYIPLLPRSLIDFLFAPMPFIIGMHHQWVKGQLTGDMASDMVIVDLDSNRVTRYAGASDKRVRQLPARERKKLKRGLTLLRLYKDKSQRSEYEKRMMDSMDDAFTYAPSPDEIEQLMADQEKEETELAKHIEAELKDETKQNTNHQKQHSTSASLSSLPSPYNAELFLSSLFFRAFTSLLKDYRPYLIMPTATNPSPDPCFHIKTFLRQNDSSSHSFMSELLSTQAFTNFCEERLHPSPHTQSAVVFFDESIIAKRNRSRLNRNQPTPFLADERYSLKETYVVPTADVTGCKGEYRYSRWPDLDYKLFPLPRKMPAMLSRRPTLLNGIGATSDQSPSGGAGDRGRRYSVTSTATLEQTLYSVWFVLVTSIASEYQILHLLASCFHVLYDARLCSVRLEQDVFVRVMKAAAGLSMPDRAVEALSIMQDTGYPLDGGVYGQLLAIFSEKGGEGMEALKRLRGEGDKRREGLAAGYSPAASPQASVSRGDDSDSRGLDDDDEDDEVDDNDVELSLTSSTHSNNSVLSPTHPDNSNSHQLLSPSNGDERDERKASIDQAIAVTSPRADGDDERDEEDEEDAEEPHNAVLSPSPDDLTRFHRNFAAAFPHLSIDTTDRCPECKRELSDREIRHGWTERNTDYTTSCPKCGERFAAQFVISNNPKAASPLTPLDPPPMPSSPSSDHAGSSEAEQFAWQLYKQAQQYRQLASAYYSSSSERFPLTVPYLPPRVLHKELTRVIEQHGIGYIVHPGFRLHSTALYWNTVWHLLCVQLPVQFMLWELSSDQQHVKQARSAALEMVHVGRYMSDEQRVLRKERLRLAQRHQRKRRDRRSPRTPQQSQPQQSEPGTAWSKEQLQMLSPPPLSPQADRLPTVQEMHPTVAHGDESPSEQHTLP